jgi:hypothetical protein
MPTFNDSEPIGPRATLMPEGDYVLTVRRFQQRISTGTKTSGAALYVVEFDMDPDGAASDVLIDAPGTAWRIDIFLKACGLQLDKGIDFEFRRDLAAGRSVKWIDPIGLRCHAHVIVDSYTGKNGTVYKSNKVGAYLLNKGPLPRLEPQELDQEEEDKMPF